MEFIVRLLIPLLLVGAVTAVIACLAIYNRKRRQKTRPAIAKGAERIATDETQPTPVEETQAEEAQLTVIEEAERTAPEKTKLTIPEEAQPQARDEVSQKAEGERRKPGERGGRPRGHEEEPTQEPKQYRPKPEIVCWKRERLWIPGIEVPEDLAANSGLALSQNGLALTQDESRGDRWRLEGASGQAVIQWNENEAVRKIAIALGKESYLLFKLTGQDQKEGRWVNFPSSGSYLVIVPEDWQRDETLSGSPPVMPEPVSLPGYRAHFFELEKGGDGKIAFRLANGNSCIIESKASQFELLGTCLNDATEGMGPLFGVSPPRICVRGDRAWEDISAIVVGEEGSKRGRWRTQMTPVPDVREQELPAEVAARKGGWYFLRFYNTNDDLIESLDFRFISALREIRIHQPQPLPSENGHRPVQAELIHEPGCLFQLADSSKRIHIESQNEQTNLIIPSDPTRDETCLLVGPAEGPRVEITILVERLWWAVGEEDNEPLEWRDLPLTLSRDDFAAMSRRAVWVRFPRRRWVNRVFVGFEQAKARPYNVKVTDKTIAIPFREFGDSEEIADKMHEYSLEVWIERNGLFIERVVAFIPTSQPEVSPPTPYWIGFGRKKTAVARAEAHRGSGAIKINGQPIDSYFMEAPLKAKSFLRRLIELNEVHQVLLQMEVLITVRESSPTTTRQAKAAAHALARALMSYDPRLTPLLKKAGFGGVRVEKPPVPRERGAP